MSNFPTSGVKVKPSNGPLMSSSRDCELQNVTNNKINTTLCRKLVGRVLFTMLPPLFVEQFLHLRYLIKKYHSNVDIRYSSMNKSKR